MVETVMKQDQRTGNSIASVVKIVLTKSANHPHGVKVQIESGEVGRVTNILLLQQIRPFLSRSAKLA